MSSFVIAPRRCHLRDPYVVRLVKLEHIKIRE